MDQLVHTPIKLAVTTKVEITLDKGSGDELNIFKHAIANCVFKMLNKSIIAQQLITTTWIPLLKGNKAHLLKSIYLKYSRHQDISSHGQEKDHQAQFQSPQRSWG